MPSMLKCIWVPTTFARASSRESSPLNAWATSARPSEVSRDR